MKKISKTTARLESALRACAEKTTKAEARRTAITDYVRAKCSELGAQEHQHPDFNGLHWRVQCQNCGAVTRIHPNGHVGIIQGNPRCDVHCEILQVFRPLREGNAS